MTICSAYFPGTPASVAAARAFVAGALDIAPEAAAPPEVADNAQLLVSELVTNAITHTRSGDPNATFHLHASVQPQRLSVDVRTEAPRTPGEAPRVRPATETAQSGRGLLLVRALATQWGPLRPWEEGVFFTLHWPAALSKQD